MNYHIERTKRMIEVMQAYVDGEEVESSALGMAYTGVGTPSWNWMVLDYRIAKTPDTINWDHVAPEFKYMARDESGKCFIYNKKPSMSGSVWYQDICIRASAFSSYRKGTADWKESLVIRPGCE